jgi:hypothetical protein
MDPNQPTSLDASCQPFAGKAQRIELRRGDDPVLASSEPRYLVSGTAWGGFVVHMT